VHAGEAARDRGRRRSGASESEGRTGAREGRPRRRQRRTRRALLSEKRPRRRAWHHRAGARRPGAQDPNLVSTSPELESRVARLEAALAEVEGGLAKLEHKRGQAPLPVPEEPKKETTLLAVAGICSLILGGAFVLRALTESQTIPRLAGAILGLA